MKRPFKLTPDIPTEDYECQCLIQWAALQKWQGQRLTELLIMIPNGAYLGGDPRQRSITMARMKRCGFRNGVFDYLLPIPMPHAPGLWIEMKRSKGGVVSDEQDTFKASMLALGWHAEICAGWELATQTINRYLGRN